MHIKLACDPETTLIVVKGFSKREVKCASELHRYKEAYDMSKGAVKRPRIRIRVPVPKPGAAHRDKSKYRRTPKHKRGYGPKE